MTCSTETAAATTTPAIDHARAVVHQEEAGDNWRTARSGVYTKLADVRSHDHGKQELAHHKIAHHAETVAHRNNVKDECRKLAS